MHEAAIEAWVNKQYYVERGRICIGDGGDATWWWVYVGSSDVIVKYWGKHTFFNGNGRCWHVIEIINLSDPDLFAKMKKAIKPIRKHESIMENDPIKQMKAYGEAVILLADKGWTTTGYWLFRKDGQIYDLSAADLDKIDYIVENGLCLCPY